MHRLARYEEVIAYYQQGKGMTAIAQLLHMSPKTVRKFVYAEAFPERSVQKRRQNYRLAPYLPYLQERVEEGCENASLLWGSVSIWASLEDVRLSRRKPDNKPSWMQYRTSMISSHKMRKERHHPAHRLSKAALLLSRWDLLGI
jgi:hypothetical protein